MRGLEGKVAVVTGGGNGIGRACAERFAEEGVAVVVADLLEGPGMATVDAVKERGGRAVFIATDVTDPAANDAMAARAVEDFGGVDILVTAAGISHSHYRSGEVDADLARFAEQPLQIGRPEGFVGMPLEEWSTVLNVNLTGTMLGIQSVARQMIAQGHGGSIVTIASIAAKVPEAGTPSYGVSKAGVWMLTKQAAVALADASIRVNAIGPGFIKTNMTTMVQGPIADHFLANVPMGRMGEPSEIASTAAFLASDDASYFTGELLHPDGGYFTD